MDYFLAESNNFQSKNLAINSLYLQKRIDFKLMNTKADSKKLLSSYIYIYTGLASLIFLSSLHYSEGFTTFLVIRGKTT